MRNILLFLAYDGNGYSGYQLQKNSTTVQGVLQESIGKITGEKVNLTSSGRTDAGVHAVAQVVNFHTGSRLKPENMVKALNSVLPHDVRVLESREVPDEFDARKNVVRKTYEYLVYNGPVLPPFYRGFAWYIPSPRLDHEILTRAGEVFIGEHDFASFMGSGSSVKGTVRKVDEFTLRRVKDLVVFRVSGSGFLKNMVRNMVGTIADVARGKIEMGDLAGILSSRDRRKAGMCAPGSGLYLSGIDYTSFSFTGTNPFLLDV